MSNRWSDYIAKTFTSWSWCKCLACKWVKLLINYIKTFISTFQSPNQHRRKDSWDPPPCTRAPSRRSRACSCETRALKKQKHNDHTTIRWFEQRQLTCVRTRGSGLSVRRVPFLLRWEPYFSIMWRCLKVAQRRVLSMGWWMNSNEIGKTYFLLCSGGSFMSFCILKRELLKQVVGALREI